MQKPLWFEISKKEFEDLTKYIYNNQDNNDFEIIINKRTYDLKNAKNFWTEVTTSKTLKVRRKNCITNRYKKTLIHWKEKKVIGLKNIIS